MPRVVRLPSMTTTTADRRLKDRYAQCPTCGERFALPQSDADSALVVQSLPELEDLGSEDLDVLEKAAITIVRLRFHARRRAIMKSRREAVPYDGDPSLAPVPYDGDPSRS